jgi:hypothetical protein
MLDVDTRLQNATVLDISAGGPDNGTAFNVGRNGLAGEIWFVVHITDGTAAAIEPLTFDLEYTIDNGTTWNTAATVTFQALAAAAELQAVPVGPIDLRTEAYAAANIDVRVTANWTTVASADDVTYSAYLAGPQPQAPSDDV